MGLGIGIIGTGGIARAHVEAYRNVPEAKSIIQGREPSVPGEEGLRSLAVIEAIYQSSAEGRAVRLDPHL